MKRICNIVIMVIGLVLASMSNSVATESSTELILKHSIAFDGRPVDVVLDKSLGRISMRIQNHSVAGPEIELLKNLIEEMTSETGRKIKLSDGYTIIYDGGYPEWAPYYSDGAHIEFSREVSVHGNKEIHFRGDTEKPLGCYPYDKK